MVQVKHHSRVALCVDLDILDRLDMHVPVGRQYFHFHFHLNLNFNFNFNFPFSKTSSQFIGMEISAKPLIWK